MGKYVTTLITFVVLLSLYPGIAKPQEGKEIIYAGTFSDQGLIVLEFNRENRSFTEIQRISDIEGPNFQSLHPNREYLYSVSSQGVRDDDEYGSVSAYRIDRETGKLTPAKNPHVENVPGSGPRHFTIHPDGGYAYSVEELSSTVAVFSVDPSTGALEQFQRVEMLPADFNGTSTAADIHISPDGRFLYATNRGHDSIAIFSIDESSGRLSFVDREPTRGGHPRNFAIDKQGEFIFVANRDNDNIVLFERDTASGLLTYTGIEAVVPRAVCVTQLFLE